MKRTKGIQCAVRYRKADECNWISRMGKVRDFREVGVEECSDCGLVSHEIDLHAKIDYKQGSMHDWSKGYGGTLDSPKEDIERRLAEIKKLQQRFKIDLVLDFGSGKGEMLAAFKNIFTAEGLEPEFEARMLSEGSGHLVYESWDSISATSTKFDLVTMFHVIEHLYLPHEDLIKIYGVLKAGGLIAIETPNCNDALLKLYKSESFSNFTYWSHHPMLHSHHSLKGLVESNGFRVIENHGVQRYGLANHLYWLLQGKPGGHELMESYFNEDTNTAYANDLKKVNLNDTIWLVAIKD